MGDLNFNRAIVRTAPRAAVNGLRAVDVGAPDIDALRREQNAYIAALQSADVTVSVLPPLEAYPDSLFVEDVALVFTGAAILLRPGAPTRRGEAAEIAPALERTFERVLLFETGTAEGGDVLTTPRGVYIGLSGRTNAAGAEALVGLLAQIGRPGFVVQAPPDVLHLKSDCALLDEETILCTARLAASEPFPGFRLLLTPEGEEGAANALRVGGEVFLSDAYPRTVERLAAEGYAIKPLATHEIAKVDAGLSCMSLRWRDL